MSYNPFYSTTVPQQHGNPQLDPFALDFALPLGKPTKFSGDSLDLEGFIQHCEIVFQVKMPIK